VNKKEDEITKRIEDVFSSTRRLVADSYRITVGDASAQASDLLQDVDNLMESAWTARMRIVDYLKVRYHRG
jgi:hypothetical protein